MVNTVRELENPEEQPSIKKMKADEVVEASPETTTSTATATTESTSEGSDKATPKTLGLYYVTMYTSDIQKSVKFFVDVFGFKQRKMEGKEWENWVELATPGQHSTNIGFLRSNERVAAGTVEFSFVVADLEKFHSSIHDIKDLVVRNPPTRQFWGGFTADYIYTGLEKEVLFKVVQDWPFRADFDKKFYSPITDDSTYLYFTNVISDKVLEVAKFFETVVDFKEHGYPASEGWAQLKGPGTHSCYLAAGNISKFTHESYKQGSIQLEFVVPDVEKFHEAITQDKDIKVITTPEKTSWGSASASYLTFDGVHIGVAQNCEVIKSSLEKEVAETESAPSTKADEVEKKEQDATQ